MALSGALQPKWSDRPERDRIKLASRPRLASRPYEPLRIGTAPQELDATFKVPWEVRCKI